jgi:hypothetical protein
VLRDNEQFSEFLMACTGFDATELLAWAGISDEVNKATGSSEQDAYTIFTRNYKLGSTRTNDACLDYNVKMFNTYNYTLFAPDNKAMELAYAAGLPRWTNIVALFEKYPQEEDHEPDAEELADMAKAKTMITQIRDFVRFHFVTNSVYADNVVEGGRYQTLSSDATGVSKEITLQGGNGQLVVKDRSSSGHTVTINASDASKIVNKMTRDYWFNSSKLTATGIETSSFCAVHQISEPLYYNENARFDQ